MTTTFSTCNSKGGAGKTATAVNLAAEASFTGRRSLLVDLDPDGNASAAMGAPEGAAGVAQALQMYGLDGESGDPDQAADCAAGLIRPTEWPDVDVLPAGEKLLAVSGEQVSEFYALADILERVRDTYDVILIDTPGNRGNLPTFALYACDVMLATMTPNSDAIAGAAGAIQRAHRVTRAREDLQIGGVIVTGVQRTTIHAALIETAEERLGEYLLGGDMVIPHRVAVQEAYETHTRLRDLGTEIAVELADVYRRHLERVVALVPVGA